MIGVSADSIEDDAFAGPLVLSRDAGMNTVLSETLAELALAFGIATTGRWRSNSLSASHGGVGADVTGVLATLALAF